MSSRCAPFFVKLLPWPVLYTNRRAVASGVAAVWSGIPVASSPVMLPNRFPAAFPPLVALKKLARDIGPLMGVPSGVVVFASLLPYRTTIWFAGTGVLKLRRASYTRLIFVLNRRSSGCVAIRICPLIVGIELARVVRSVHVNSAVAQERIR